ncbi:hypothetical protein HIM_02416 [Hirsutella minnesotensis 3608]|nr:hypothetical protein HIM_02416 [Hirsutella minnesotensis 3608]
MRFSFAFTGLLASTAAAAVATIVDVDAVATADLADVVRVDADAEVHVSRRHHDDAGASTNDNYILGEARRAAQGFRCPSDMTYCPWTKACACAPGLKLDVNSRKCVGRQITGAWPEPRADVYASKGVKLAPFCASSPYRIVKYNAQHELCQASPNNIAFVASAEIEVEIDGLAEAEIEVESNISAELKAVCAGLAGLYVNNVVDAVVLFNTNVFGHAVAKGDVSVRLGHGLLGSARGLFCAVGLGRCNFDCVSYCTKGCKNFIDAGAEIGANHEGLVGLAILPNILLVVDSAKAVTSIAAQQLLCTVGGLVKSLLSRFSCNCS